MGKIKLGDRVTVKSSERFSGSTGTVNGRRDATACWVKLDVQSWEIVVDDRNLEKVIGFDHDAYDAFCQLQPALRYDAYRKMQLRADKAESRAQELEDEDTALRANRRSAENRCEQAERGLVRLKTQVEEMGSLRDLSEILLRPISEPGESLEETLSWKILLQVQWLRDRFVASDPEFKVLCRMHDASKEVFDLCSEHSEVDSNVE